MQKSMKSRRKFIQTLTLASAASLIPIHLSHSTPMPSQKIIHQVYFWLHKEADVAEFLRDAVPMLGRCKDVTQFYQGVPAPTEKREVVDHSFHVSWTSCLSEGPTSPGVHFQIFFLLENCEGV
jgi:hypothetical protein